MPQNKNNKEPQLPFYKRWQFFIFIGLVLILIGLTLPLVINMP